MAYIRKIKGSLVKMDRTEYIGEDTYLFYDIDTGCIYRSNGLPGGEPICGGAGGSGGGVLEFPSVTDFPNPGEDETIYIAADTSLIYRWDDTLPGYVPLVSQGADDNVNEYPSITSFPPVGVKDVIYLDAEHNFGYRWNGTAYEPVSAGHDHSVLVIPGLSTATLYTEEAPTANLSLKFILSTKDTVDERFMSSELLGAYKLLDNSLRHNHYSLVGDRINMKPELVYSATDIQLNIVNNEVNPITVSVIRVPTLPL
jgi:hypothetical protein